MLGHLAQIGKAICVLPYRQAQVTRVLETARWKMSAVVGPRWTRTTYLRGNSL
jgi:hypothetical protein